MATPSECRIVLGEVAIIINKHRKGAASLDGTLATAEAELNGLPNTYAEWIAEINAQAAANPDDAAWEGMKAELALFTAEFQDLKAAIAAMRAALAGV